MSWSIEQSKEVYAIDKWGKGYFDVNEKGNVVVCPMGTDGRKIDLYDLTLELQERGIRCPVLLRFPDITRERIKLINDCFASAINEYKYQGTYMGVYPIKVNQQRHLVEDLVKMGLEHNLGLECGSKPELLAVLAMVSNPNALLICNGFKDAEYVETAVLSRKLGRNTLVVMDRLDELDLIINASKKFGILPRIGVRSKLQSKASGRWVDSAGERSKFGLTTSEVFAAYERLKKEKMLDCLELLHFHIGSQIPSIKDIKSALREGAQIYCELYRMGCKIKYIDVGGGLGVDYDGSGKSEGSTNYDTQEYANDVVSIIQSVCEEKQTPTPNIVSESGRALVAHQSVLIFNVIGQNQLEYTDAPPAVDKHEHKVLQELKEIYATIDEENVKEFYHDLVDIKENSLQLFTFGILTLEQKAKIEKYFWSISTKMLKLLKDNTELKDLTDSLKNLLSDTYFCNFSVFQSMPDSWAVDQVFPFAPIHRHLEKPDREAVLVDLTCDSDGKIRRFIDHESEESATTLSVHRYDPATPYYFGAFLVGAYQEILGDLHNLFGDTDAVHVSLNETGYTIDSVVEGDTVAEVLSYVAYQREELMSLMRQACERSIEKNEMTTAEAKRLLNYYQQGLSGYTYLEDAENMFG